MARQRTLLGWMLAAVAALSLGQLLSLGDLRRPAETAAVVLYTGRTAWVEGVVIRQEVPVTADPSADWTPVLRDGQRSAAGQVLLRTETDAETAVLARRVRVLRTGTQAAGMALPERRQAIHGAIARMNAAGEDRTEACEALTGLLLGEAANPEDALTAAENALRDHPGPRSRTVTAPEAGVFAAQGDGLEEILTPEDPWVSWPLPQAPLPRETAGRLITGDRWYFRTELPFAAAAGETLTGYLPWRQEPLTLTVEQVRPGGLVLLSCGQMLDQVAAVRQIQMKILENCETGLEIPAAGVYTVEGETGVWVQTGQAARFQPVTVRQTMTDTVVVELPEDRGLLPGDQILLDAQ